LSALPGGGGFPIDLQVITSAAALRPAQNYITFESDYGDERAQYWHGVTVSATARLAWGLTVQGGTTTGRGVRDRCDTAAALPEEFLISAGSPIARIDTCKVTEPWLTSVRGLALSHATSGATARNVDSSKRERKNKTDTPPRGMPATSTRESA